MLRLEDLSPGTSVKGIGHEGVVTVVATDWLDTDVLTVTYRDADGRVDEELLYRNRETELVLVSPGGKWRFDGDGADLRLVSEARRISLAHLFDPLLAMHSAVVEPLPHQIDAVYGELLPRQPLRFLLADDPGAGKTIMAGLLIKELMLRGDVARCLIVCPAMLVEQWQDELQRRFHLRFQALTKEALLAAGEDNWFAETRLVIGRLDMLSRNEALHTRLKQTEWDLVVVDEAHRMAAEFVGAEVKTTKRFRLGELLAGATRHLLLLSATPHNGKEPDFQLFMGLLDGDRFPGGRPTAEARPTYTADLMRRMVKEDLVRFDGTPLFPERIATTLSYRLSPAEAELYDAVTSYVRHEFDRAEELETGRKSRIGFALTVLQRRLASSPQAIHQSLKRRRERLEQRRRELPASPAEQPLPTASEDLPEYTADDWDDLAEAQAADVEEQEAQFVDQATAATTVAELQEELRTLEALEARALKVLQSGADRKWEELRRLLADDASMRDAHGRRRKLVVFTEHRDTLLYLADRIRAFLGRPEAVACIHGGLSRTARLAAQAAFTQDRHVEVLVATDAAGEGINLQRAHLMVNYDLPWNPNRLEQRFGRIHRIGQTEVCHLWNLVADQTREGDVFHRLLSKIEQQCAALQGKVFDILGRLLNEAELHQMMIEAVRYGDSPETREKLRLQIDHAVDPERLRALFEDRALARNALDTSKLHAIREHMERANARRLQPHYIAGFFIAALRALGGTIEEREPGRYEIHQVPLHVRHRSLSASAGGVALPRYERVTFDTDVRSADAEVAVDLLGPGHPLLAAVVDATLERHRALLRRGAVLVDSTNRTAEPRALVYLDHAIRDGRTDRTGQRCVVSQRMYFVELSADGAGAEAGPAPYLDYRPLAAGELAAAHDIVAACAAWRIEDRATRFAAAHLVPQHLEDVRREKVEYVRKVAQAVEDRLTKEIRYWQQRAEQLLHEEQAGGKPKMSSRRARELAAEMEARLQRRLDELRREAQVAPAPPNVVGAALVIPVALLDRAQAQPERSLGRPALAEARAAVEHRAMAAVMAHERALGCEPVDVSAENRGYDIESRDHSRGRLRFIEVKGRAAGAGTVTVSRNEVLTALNKPDAYILAIVEIDGDRETVHYHQRPFQGDHGFAVTHVTYDFGKLLAGKGARA